MGFLQVFLNQDLQARRDQLNAQVLAMQNLQDQCNNVPSSSWVEWSNDKRDWDTFYSNESNWVTSSDNKKALDDWQTKMQTWSNRFASYGCAGTLGSVDGINVVSAVGNTDNGIPTIKDAPPDDPGIVDSLLGTVHKVTDPFTSAVTTASWVAIGVVILIVIVLGYVLVHGQASGYGVKVGG